MKQDKGNFRKVKMSSIKAVPDSRLSKWLKQVLVPPVRKRMQRVITPQTVQTLSALFPIHVSGNEENGALKVVAGWRTFELAKMVLSPEDEVSIIWHARASRKMMLEYFLVEAYQLPALMSLSERDAQLIKQIETLWFSVQSEPLEGLREAADKVGLSTAEDRARWAGLKVRTLTGG